MTVSKRVVVLLIAAVTAVGLSGCAPALLTDVAPQVGFYDQETGIKVTHRCEGSNMVYLAHSVGGSGTGIAVVGNDARCKG